MSSTPERPQEPSTDKPLNLIELLYLNLGNTGKEKTEPIEPARYFASSNSEDFKPVRIADVDSARRAAIDEVLSDPNKLETAIRNGEIGVDSAFASLMSCDSGIFAAIGREPGGRELSELGDLSNPDNFQYMRTAKESERKARREPSNDFGL